VPTSIARAFVHELDLSTRAPISPLLELLLKKAAEDAVSGGSAKTAHAASPTQ